MGREEFPLQQCKPCENGSPYKWPNPLPEKQMPEAVMGHYVSVLETSSSKNKAKESLFI